MRKQVIAELDREFNSLPRGEITLHETEGIDRCGSKGEVAAQSGRRLESGGALRGPNNTVEPTA